MIGWQIIITIFAFFSYYNYGLNTAMAVSFILQSLYIAKFFFWETGYFNTLDITLDRAGYYICWGCIVFVPAFYTFASYYLANNPSNVSLGVGRYFWRSVSPLYGSITTSMRKRKHLRKIMGS
jgi:7-dehydrocholesterol reductase